ncbi:MAG TPA: DUF1302 family protein, partial [Cellvibrionaceae bacterium]
MKLPINLTFILITMSPLLLCAPVLANDFFGTVQTSAETSSHQSDSPWTYRAWLQQKTGYGYRTPAANVNRDQPDLTRTETQFYNQLNWRQGNWRLRLAGSLVHDWLPDMERAGLWNGYEFSDQDYDQRRWRIDLSDTYISWQEGDWWIKGGYQTLAWGEAESLKVTDILARRDQRWPGQDDLENLRLPVPAISISWNNQWDLVLLAETLPDRQSAAYSEFDPYISLRTGNTATDPVFSFSQDNNPGIALRWRQSWQGFDAQFMLADIAGYEYLPQSITLQQNTPPEIHLQPARQQVAGFGLQMTRGTWLLRTEQAWHKDAQTLASNPEDLSHTTDQWRSMLGADYTGINNLTLTGELSWIYSDQTENNQSHWQEGASARANYTLY